MNEIRNLSKALHDGGVVLLKSDTVYALCVAADDYDAAQQLYQIKNRSLSKKMAVIFRDVDHVEDYIDFPDSQTKEDWQKIMSYAITSVMYKKKESNNLYHSLLEEDHSLAFRVASNEYLLRLLNDFGKPIIATSANISEEAYVHDSQKILSIFVDKVASISSELYHCRPCDSAIDYTHSTIVDFTKKPYRILREGKMSRADLVQKLGAGRVMAGE